MRRARLGLGVAALALVFAVSCGRSKPVGVAPGDGGGGTDAEAGTPSTLRGCLDSPDELTRPPSGMLPCDLIPPGLKL